MGGALAMGGAGEVWDEAACLGSWVKTSLLSQLSLLNINFIFQVFAKKSFTFL